MSETDPDHASASPPGGAVGEPSASPRLPCPAPADFRGAVAAYDEKAKVGVWQGPRYRMTYRVLGDGPPLILIPGIASTYRGYALTLNALAERFRTLVYDYPGEQPGDGARLGRITHDDLVDDVFGLSNHLDLGQTCLFGLSFGSTVALRALHRDPSRFPSAVVQGAFARRKFTPVERFALRLGRMAPGTVRSLPFRRAVLSYNNKLHFPEIIADRWDYYVEQNGLTPIGPMAHRLDLVARLDLRPVLKEIRSRVLILQGNEDRVVPRGYFEELRDGLPGARGVVMPLVGHQPHYTHAEALAQAVIEWCLPAAHEGCPGEGTYGAGSGAGSGGECGGRLDCALAQSYGGCPSSGGPDPGGKDVQG